MLYFRAVLLAMVLTLLAFELSVIVVLAFFPYLPDPGLVALSSNVYALLEPLSVVLSLGLLYSWLVKFFANQARCRWARFDSLVRFFGEPFRRVVVFVRSTSLTEAGGTIKRLRFSRLMLAIGLILSVLLVFIPYRPDLNPTRRLVGVDSPLYVGWVNQMLVMQPGQALHYAFITGLDGSRPLLLTILYGIASNRVPVTTVLEYVPMFLAPLLSLSTYIYVKYGQGNAGLASLTSLFTPISFYDSVGLWGGYYANWLALILSYFFMTALLIYSRTPTHSKYVLMTVLSILLFLTHPWTWILVTSVTFVFVVTIWRETRSFILLRPIIGMIALGVLLDVAKSLIFATQPVAIDITTKSPTSPSQLLGFWNNLVEALINTHGGLMADWLVLGLAFSGILCLKFMGPFERLTLLWCALPSIPFLVLDSYSQARILYDLPIPILTSVGTVYLAMLIGKKHPAGAGILILFILIASTIYALQTVLQL